MIEITLALAGLIIPMWPGEKAFCLLFPGICKKKGWGPWR